MVKKKKEIKDYGILIIGILAIISIFIIVGVNVSNNVQSNIVLPSANYPYKISSVPYEKVKDYQFCHAYECEINCRPFPEKKCVKYIGGSCLTVYTNLETGQTWNQYWKCE